VITFYAPLVCKWSQFAITVEVFMDGRFCSDWSVGEGDDKRLLSVNKRASCLRWLGACCTGYTPASGQSRHTLSATGIHPRYRYIGKNLL